MITSVPHNYCTKANFQVDCSLGNVLMVIAGIIGVATKKNYKWAFQKWVNQQYFINPLSEIEPKDFPKEYFQLPQNFKGFDIGFRGFDIPDDVIVNGYFGSEKYWSHCEDLVRHYLTMKDICDPYEDTILMHFRHYNNEAWNQLDGRYYREALKHFPQKKVVVVTDNIDAAKRFIKMDVEYISNTPIIDFYYLSHTKYLVMANSTLSYMAAYLSKAKTVAPENWYAGSFKNCPKEDNYCKGWIRI
jgi:hypothetical protein